MDYKEQLKSLRNEFDDIDRQLVSLFEKRMKLGEKVAEIKRAGNIAITDEKREQAVVDNAVKLVEKGFRGEVTAFMRVLISLSKSRQRRILIEIEEEKLLDAPRTPVKEGVKVAYQGVPGAWGEQAVMALFQDVSIDNLESFEDVFIAVKDRKVNYGVVPIENSQTGAIGEVYDLLRKYGCYIVGQTWVPIRHCLMGTKGAALTDIREVLSHPEGFGQCREFLKNRSWDLTACRNTAVAAEVVAGKNESRFAAIGSKRAAQLNGLDILVPDIMTHSENKTRFIVIADEPEYDETSNIVSVIFRTLHRSGALCDVLFPLMSEGINLTRIESRPGTDERYCFFADLQGNIDDPAVASAIRQAASSCGYLEVLGCYRENAQNYTA